MTQPTDLADRSSDALDTVTGRVLDDHYRIGNASLVTVRAAVAGIRWSASGHWPQVETGSA